MAGASPRRLAGADGEPPASRPYRLPFPRLLGGDRCHLSAPCARPGAPAWLEPIAPARPGGSHPAQRPLRGRGAARHRLARHIFDADAYVALLDTYSDHRTLPARRRQRLFDAIRRLAVDEFGGQVQRYYRTVIYLARSR
jgi:hypothetical protein